MAIAFFLIPQEKKVPRSQKLPHEDFCLLMALLKFFSKNLQWQKLLKKTGFISLKNCVFWWKIYFVFLAIFRGRLYIFSWYKHFTWTWLELLLSKIWRWKKNLKFHMKNRINQSFEILKLLICWSLKINWYPKLFRESFLFVNSVMESFTYLPEAVQWIFFSQFKWFV